MKKEKTLSEKEIWMHHNKTNQECFCLTKEDVKQFIKQLKEFIKERTYIKQDSPSLVRFMPFEFEDFLKENVGELK